MTFVLLFFGIAASARIIDLSAENWAKVIDKRNPDSVWVVAFYDSAIPPFVEAASKTSDGMINYAKTKDEIIAMRYNVKFAPTILIFNKDGNYVYGGKRTDRALINAAAKHIPDKTLPVDLTWKEDEIDTAILFTDKKSTPPMWASISCAFQGKIRVGICRDPDLRAEFGVSAVPTILFKNKTSKILVTSKMTYGSIKQSLSDFVLGVYENPIEFNNDYFLPEEYDLETLGFGGFCIIHCVSDLDPVFAELKGRNSSGRFKWFYGEEDLPFDFMAPGDLWVVHPKRQAALKVESVETLGNVLNEIIDGTLKMKPIESFI